jgi:hypothetical protein
MCGMAAGFMSGARGAAAYAISCKNDGSLFVAMWYSPAIVITGALEALAGRCVLSW